MTVLGVGVLWVYSYFLSTHERTRPSGVTTATSDLLVTMGYTQVTLGLQQSYMVVPERTGHHAATAVTSL